MLDDNNKNGNQPQQRQQHPGVGNLLVYLAVPPHVFAEATRALQKALLPLQQPPDIGRNSYFVRVVLEKPFGRDTDSCRALLQALNSSSSSLGLDYYRIDHYLAKVTVQNILTLRRQLQVRQGGG